MSQRVGIISPAFERGGSEEYVIALARYLQRDGYLPLVCLPEADGVATVRSDLAASGIEVESFPAWPHPVFSDVTFRASRSAVLRLIRDRCLDKLVIVLPGIEFGGALIDAAAMAGVPTAVLYQLVGYAHPFIPLERQILTWARRQRQVWLTVSQHNRDLLCQSLGWQTNAVDVVPNSLLRSVVRVGDPERQQRRLSLRRELGIPRDSFVALTVGRLHVQKAHDVLITAAQSLIGRYERVHFVWAGSGDAAEHLEAEIIEHGLSGHVHMLGHRADVAELLLPAADAFVLASMFEGMPFAALEAMAAGVPSVLSDIGPHREVATDGREALLVPVGDGEAVARAIERLLMEPEAAKAIGAAAHLRACDHAPGVSFRRLLECIDTGVNAPRPVTNMWPLVEGPKPRVAIFGAGGGGRKALTELLPSREVVAFLDSRAFADDQLMGLPILRPDAVHDLNVEAVVLASLHGDEMHQQLLALGFPEDRIETFPVWRLLPPEAA